MSRVRVRVTGAEALARALQNATDTVRASTARAIDATGLELRGNIIRAYQQGPATGITYRKYAPRREHTASAPGEAPATDTGRLASSVEFRRESDLSVSVGSTLVYAALLEFGTRSTAPRPAWVPAAEQIQPTLQRRVEAAIEGALK